MPATLTKPQTIPFTTEDSCLKYKTTVNSCLCYDRGRGGSYICPMRKDKICKHIFMRRMQAHLVGRENELAQAVWIMNLAPVLPADKAYVADMQVKAKATIKKFQYIGMEI